MDFLEEFVKYLNIGFNQVSPFINTLLKNEIMCKGMIKNLKKHELLILPYAKDINTPSTFTYYFQYIVDYTCFNTFVIDGDKAPSFRLPTSYEDLRAKFDKQIHNLNYFLNGRENLEDFSLLVLEQFHKSLKDIFSLCSNTGKMKEYLADSSSHANILDESRYNLIKGLSDLNMHLRLCFFMNLQFSKLMYTLDTNFFSKNSSDTFGEYIPKHLLENISANSFAITYTSNEIHDLDELEEVDNVVLGFVVQKREKLILDVLCVLYSVENKRKYCINILIDARTLDRLDDVACYNTAVLLENINISETTPFKNMYSKYKDKLTDKNHRQIKAFSSVLNHFLCSLFLIQDDSEYCERSYLYKETEKKKTTSINVNATKGKTSLKGLFSKKFNFVEANKVASNQLREFNKKLSNYNKLSSSERKKVKPHIRRGHIHTFYTGSMKDGSVRKSITKWVKPIFINANILKSK